MRKIFFILSILTIFSCNAAEQDQTAPSFDYKNTEKVLSYLNSNVSSDMFPKECSIKYIGNPDNGLTSFYVYLTEIIWGESKRSTKRLVLLSPDGKYVGQYSHFSENELYFENEMIRCKVGEPNATGWDFTTSKPPSLIVINGEEAEFYK